MRLDDVNPIERFSRLEELIESGGPAAVLGLCPLSRWDSGHMGCPEHFRDLGRRIVDSLAQLCAVLQGFADAVETSCAPGIALYLLGDDSVAELMSPGLARRLAAAGLPLSILLESLATLGLIYRFDVAFRFGYVSPIRAQLRVNGWGQQFVKTKGLAAGAEFCYSKGAARRVLLEHEATYSAISSACRANPPDVLTIHSLNRRVRVPVVI